MPTVMCTGPAEGAVEPRSTLPTELAQDVVVGFVRALEEEIRRPLREALPTSTVAVLDHLIEAALREFVGHRGDGGPALRHLAADVAAGGRQLAYAGVTAETVARAFDHVAAIVALRLDAARAFVTIPAELRHSALVYVRAIHDVGQRGLAEGRAACRLSGAERRQLLAGAILRRDVMPAAVLEVEGLSETVESVAVAAVAGRLPAVVLRHATVVLDTRQREAVMRSTAWEALAQRARGFETPVVVGPRTPLQTVSDSLHLVRHGVDVLRSGEARPSGPVTSCAELTSTLLCTTNTALAGMLIAQHLGPLSALGPKRRVTYGRFLLDWLERGQQQTALARSLGIPVTTAHSRMAALRDIYGDTLDDPDARVEMIIALRAAIPDWTAAPPRQ
jgi:hypothetical protein